MIRKEWHRRSSVCFNDMNINLGALRDAARLWEQEKKPSSAKREGTWLFLNWLDEQHKALDRLSKTGSTGGK